MRRPFVVVMLVAVILAMGYPAGAQEYLMTVSTDWGNNGSVDEKAYWYLNAAGQVVRIEKDFDVDGTVDQVEWRYYDASGRLIRAEVGETQDGAKEWVETYQFVGPVSLRYAPQDFKHDARGDRIFMVEGKGNVEFLDKDWCADGTIEERLVFAYAPRVQPAQVGLAP